MSESSTTSTRSRDAPGGVGSAVLRVFQIAAGHESFDRAQPVVDIGDQHRIAVFHQRAGGDVPDLAEARVERLHDQHALAEKAIDHHAVGLLAVADHDQADGIACRWRAARCRESDAR